MDLDQEIQKIWNSINEIKSTINNIQKRISSHSTSIAKTTHTIPEGLSLNDKLLCLIYIYELSQGKTLIDSAKAKDLFISSREIPPKNISDQILKNTRKGFLMDSGEKNDKNMIFWTMTNAGINYAEALLNGKNK